MKLEVLIPTMNLQDGKDLFKKMNLQSDTIICNQSKSESMISGDTFAINGSRIRIYNWNERGVGLNRNNALMRSENDYCILADDDLIFVDDYPNIVKENIKKYPDADVLIFNLDEDIPKRFVTKKDFKVKKHNFMRFGAARIVVKRTSILKNNIFFSLVFGGGTEYGSGEDSIFLQDCLKKGLNVIAVTDHIAKLTDERPSTWFDGYNEKFFFDKGALYAAMYPKFARLICLQFLIRHKNIYINTRSFKQAFRDMKNGIFQYKRW